DSINHHFLSAQSASLCFMAQSGNYNIMDGKMIFLSGSPELEMHYGIKTGRLSGIINHHIPGYLSRNRLPSPAVNRIDDWEEKLEAIANESIPLDLSLIGGIPPWIQMYFDLLQKKSKKSIAELFPELKLLVHGGVNFKPYQKRLEQSLGRKINMIETYPASEAFIAFQEDYLSEGMLLNTDAGIFYEFIPLEQVFEKNPKRLSLAEVEVNRQYAIVISTNAGLWAYLLGDTIRFVSLNPYRIKVTGRIKHQLSAFGEHVIAEEVETAIKLACSEFDVFMEEFTVAPAMGDAQNLPCHEWVIAVSEKPKNEKAFAAYLDEQMYRQNIYYQDLVKGKVIQPLKVRWVKAKTFHNAMKKMGKLGGQNKAPRLMNDRSFVDLLIKNAQ
ncbi:MAG: GH3 auxin-responsive promoter family protein, partial [Chitinophagales bacterium]